MCLPKFNSEGITIICHYKTLFPSSNEPVVFSLSLSLPRALKHKTESIKLEWKRRERQRKGSPACLVLQRTDNLIAHLHAICMPVRSRVTAVKLEGGTTEMKPYHKEGMDKYSLYSKAQG